MLSQRGSSGYDSRLLLFPYCDNKANLLPGTSWPEEIQDFVEVADVRMGGTDFNYRVLAYNSVISAMEMSATPVENPNFWK